LGVQCPHSYRKLSGSPLIIIGFDIDPIATTVTLPLEKKDALVAELRRFGISPLQLVFARVSAADWLM